MWLHAYGCPKRKKNGCREREVLSYQGHFKSRVFISDMCGSLTSKGAGTSTQHHSSVWNHRRRLSLRPDLEEKLIHKRVNGRDKWGGGHKGVQWLHRTVRLSTSAGQCAHIMFQHRQKQNTFPFFLFCFFACLDSYKKLQIHRFTDKLPLPKQSKSVVDTSTFNQVLYVFLRMHPFKSSSTKFWTTSRICIHKDPIGQQ